MHACGHDMHVTWRGTLLAVFRPQRRRRGAQAMIDDGTRGDAGR